MKQNMHYLPILLFCAVGLSASAQQSPSLAGTTWQGIVRAPKPTEVIFQFKQDTLFLFDSASKVVMETTLYTQKDGQMTWRKLSGSSPCDNQTVGNYIYKIDKDQLSITPVLDVCMGRAMALVGSLKKVTWSTR